MDGTSLKTLVTSRVVDGVGVIAFRRGGIRDEAEIVRTLESLSRYVESHTQLKIVLDLGGLEYLTSVGLGRLIRLLKSVRKAGGTLGLCGLQPFVLEVFQAVRLVDIFPTYPSVEAAIESFETEYETEGTV